MDFKALQPLGWKPFFQNQIALDDDQTIVPLRVAEVRSVFAHRIVQWELRRREESGVVDHPGQQRACGSHLR